MTDNEHKSFIEASLENIRRAHNGNYLSIFAGAGISACSGSDLPSWDQLMDALRERLYGKVERDEDYRVRAEKFFEQQHGIPSQKELVDFIKKVEEKLKKELRDEIKRGGDYYPVLAEKFFNQFGHNFYYQTLGELIPSHARPNDLHLEIVKLNPKNLITTNWDNLFEKAINEEGMFFDIIKSDADMGNSTGFSKLIKMHGSLDRENIVFCDRDYLEYSQNFPLIESYIEGVFSTDLVVLVGYSLSDPNVKQIISWVTSCSENIKPIYFIKTDAAFDWIEFEFYKNKNIHVLYLSEIFGEGLDKEQEHVEELKDFFKEIKKREEKEYDFAPILSDREIEDIDRDFTYFNFSALEARIKNLAMSKGASLRDKLLMCFLRFENRADDKNMLDIYPPPYREISKEAFKNRELKIWFLSEFNRLDFYPSLHSERNNDEWVEKFLKLPLSEKEKLQFVIQLPSYFDRQLINIYHFLMQVLKKRSYEENDWFYIEEIEPKSFFSHDYEDPHPKKALRVLRDFDRIRIGNCLTIPKFEKYRTLYTRALECCWCAISLKVLSENETIFSHSIRYFLTGELEDIFRIYITNPAFWIKIDQEFLKEVFTNICHSFKEHGSFTSRNGEWFKNFLLLASHCVLEQNTFERILEEVNDKIKKGWMSSAHYGQLGEFIFGQFKSDALNWHKCLDLVSSFLNLFVESRANLSDCDMAAESTFPMILGKIQGIDTTHKDLIIDFLDTIHQNRKYVCVFDTSEIRESSPAPKPPLDLKNLKVKMIEVRNNSPFLRLIEALYQSSNEDVKKAIKDKLQYILDHKDNYPQTKASEKYCKWLEELIENLDS
ncbi:SIR2 family protein [Helicobacter salomonis]|uniref:SIR2 family protein n=1 Tax=Helicobacter salomonis TaxID=56878 RepID=UPI001F1B6E70|nr:SIR2 family protein [Helicobacter salomonis]